MQDQSAIYLANSITTCYKLSYPIEIENNIIICISCSITDPILKLKAQFIEHLICLLAMIREKCSHNYHHSPIVQGEGAGYILSKWSTTTLTTDNQSVLNARFWHLWSLWLNHLWHEMHFQATKLPGQAIMENQFIHARRLLEKYLKYFHAK